ncbi:MAG: carbohydrate-binding domain-containing protein, partial [Traorella sp.]
WIKWFLPLILILSACEAKDEPIEDDTSWSDTSEMDFSFSKRDLDSSYDNYVELKDSEVVITKEGCYLLSGNYKSVVIEANDSDKVQLVLDNAIIHNDEGPAILVKSVDKLFITLADGSMNQVSDASYTLEVDGSNVDGCIFSKCDLTINGTGKLIVNGVNKHGIVSKDDLIIVDSILEISSNGVGIEGKDCVKIKDASLSISAASDGIRSSNDEDENRGFVYIENGLFDIKALNDGIQAESVLMIADGSFTIVCGNGSQSSLSSSDESYKGLKASKDILIEDGLFVIDSQDDCLHSNQSLSINGGNFSLSSGDDGIHADSELTISGGTIDILKSYEGIEASIIRINDGEIKLKASDDGLNAAGGVDTTNTTSVIQTSSKNPPKPNGDKGGRPGQGNFSNDTGEIYISGGYLFIDASGDGIDSNGSLDISGGIILVCGPENNGNGALDYDTSATINNATLVALGSAGMAQSITSDTQGVLAFTLSSQKDTTLSVIDEEGKLILSFYSSKLYNCAIITSPNIQKDQTYSIVVDAKVDKLDQNGFTNDSTYSNGTELGTING